MPVVRSSVETAPLTHSRLLCARASEKQLQPGETVLGHGESFALAAAAAACARHVTRCRGGSRRPAATPSRRIELTSEGRAPAHSAEEGESRHCAERQWVSNGMEACPQRRRARNEGQLSPPPCCCQLRGDVEGNWCPARARGALICANVGRGDTRVNLWSASSLRRRPLRRRRPRCAAASSAGHCRRRRRRHARVEGHAGSARPAVLLRCEMPVVFQSSGA